MTSISDTIRLTNQALENALTTASVPKVSASDKQTPIYHRQQPAKRYHKATQKVRVDEAEIHTNEPKDEDGIKHVDIRI